MRIPGIHMQSGYWYVKSGRVTPRKAVVPVNDLKSGFVYRQPECEPAVTAPIRQDDVKHLKTGTVSVHFDDYTHSFENRI